MRQETVIGIIVFAAIPLFGCGNSERPAKMSLAEPACKDMSKMVDDAEHTALQKKCPDYFSEEDAKNRRPTEPTASVMDQPGMVSPNKPGSVQTNMPHSIASEFLFYGVDWTAVQATSGLRIMLNNPNGEKQIPADSIRHDRERAKEARANLLGGSPLVLHIFGLNSEQIDQIVADIAALGVNAQVSWSMPKQ